MISIVCFLVSLRFSIAIDLLIPIYGCYVCVMLLPTWYENPLKQRFLTGQALMLTTIYVYIVNAVLICFFTSNHTLSLAGRAILTVNNLNMGFRRWRADGVPIVGVLMIFVVCCLFYEAHSYSLNQEKVQLYLEKELSRKQER